MSCGPCCYCGTCEEHLSLQGKKRCEGECFESVPTLCSMMGMSPTGARQGVRAYLWRWMQECIVVLSLSGVRLRRSLWARSCSPERCKLCVITLIFMFPSKGPAVCIITPYLNTQWPARLFSSSRCAPYVAWLQGYNCYYFLYRSLHHLFHLLSLRLDGFVNFSHRGARFERHFSISDCDK